MGEFNVNKSDGSLEQTAGMPSEYPATQVMLSDGVTSVEDRLDGLTESVENNILITDGFTKSVQFTATAAITTVNISKAGYTPIMCVELHLFSGADYLQWAYLYSSGNTATIHYKGIASGSGVFAFKVIYRKATA